ncbi:Phosphate starvation-inducible protein PhoH, predicted ATPase, partial [uncultured Gammaproteobacteria bacterium]
DSFTPQKYWHTKIKFLFAISKPKMWYATISCNASFLPTKNLN